MAENPKHGDSIIEQRKGPLGGSKFVASRPFQEFLDQLTIISNDIGNVLDFPQLAEINNTLIEKMAVSVQKLRNLTTDDNQEIAVLRSQVSALQAKERRMQSRTDDLEQLIHVN